MSRALNGQIPQLVAGTLIAISVILFSFVNYYLYSVNAELRKRQVGSRLAIWFMGPFMHARFCSESRVRKKLLVCFVGMVLSGLVGIAIWMAC